MEKGREWSAEETIQLCRSWLETSEDPIRGAGQKKSSFYAKVYQHWLAQRGAGADERSEAAVSGRWKKLQPEVTKFEGIFSKLKSKERSGWNEEMFVKSAVSIYGERHKQPFEFLDAWNELSDKPKWTHRLTTSSTTLGIKHKKEAVPRPEGQKAAKAAKIAGSVGKDGLPTDLHLRFVAASKKKALVMEKQFQYSIFMLAPDSAESQEYFAIQRQAILAQLRASTCDALSKEGDKENRDANANSETIVDSFFNQLSG